MSKLTLIVAIDLVSPSIKDEDPPSTQSTPVPPSLFNCDVCGRGFKGKPGFTCHITNKYGNPNCYQHYKKLKKEEANDILEIRRNKRSKKNLAYEDILEDTEDDDNQVTKKCPERNNPLAPKRRKSDKKHRRMMLDKAINKA